MRSLGQLTTPTEGLAPRAIVLGGSLAQRLDWAKSIPMIRDVWPLVDVLVWEPRATPELVQGALRAGVREVILERSPRLARARVVRVISEQQLLPRTTQQAQSLAQTEFEGMISRSRSMHDLFETAGQVAPSAASVLILGETGTGKELLARAIHRRSGRTGRFVAINCAAVPETLIDSELFGHVEGAFTGASKPKAGLFRHADQGTLLLDEAGNVPLPVQYRLLRVLQEGAVRPVGGHAEVPVDVRVIAATSAPLEDLVASGAFREDLLYRLDVIRLVIPPLRRRHDDVIFLFATFARRFADEYRVDRPTVTDGFLDALTRYDWPGNVRQLENIVERLVLTEGGTLVTADRLGQLLGTHAVPAPGSPPPIGTNVESIDLDVPMEEALRPHLDRLERTYLEGILKRTDGRVNEAARHSGLSRRTLSRMFNRLGIDKRQFKEDG